MICNKCKSKPVIFHKKIDDWFYCQSCFERRIGELLLFKVKSAEEKLHRSIESLKVAKNRDEYSKAIRHTDIVRKELKLVQDALV